MTPIAFGLAAIVGGLVRWRATELNRSALPWGTLGVNLVASFVAALLVDVSTAASLIFITALLGSLSTFSTVVGEVEDRRNQPALAASYVGLTIIGGVGAAWLGLALS